MPRKNTRVKLICQVCGGSYERPQYRAAQSRFCSKVCAGIHYRSLSPPIPCVCEQCGKAFVLPPSTVATGRGHFCSRACKDAALRGKRGNRWDGGRHISKQGYVMIYDATTGTYEYEHRLIMEQELGRPLLPSEIVHHIGIKTDNRPWNLVVMTQAEHMRLHQSQRSIT
jgi:hypothetical protein